MSPADDLRRYVLNIEADAWALRWTDPGTCRRLSHEAHECLGLLDQLAAENAALRARNTALEAAYGDLWQRMFATEMPKVLTT